jgi:hypothetical protein
LPLENLQWIFPKWKEEHVILVICYNHVLDLWKRKPWAASWMFVVCYSLWICEPKRYQVCWVYKEWQKLKV